MKQIKFPTYNEMYPESAKQKVDKQLRDKLRYYLRTTLFRVQINQLVNYLNTHPQWLDIFKHTPYRFNALLAKYCDNRFNRQQRANAIIDHFNLSEEKIAADKWAFLIKEQSILLSQLTDEFSLHLNINNIDPFEGFFSINIQNKQKQSFYDASFSFLAENKLLIASIQGPKGENAQEQVKQVTKALYGIRPMYLLVIVFKFLSKLWALELIGIPHKAQAKYRWNDSSHLLFNYDSFWQENNAMRVDDYWILPIINERKELEDIPSKKRSMYRKRYEMLDKMEQDVQGFLLQAV